MVKIGDRVQIDEAVSKYYGRCGIVIGDAFCPMFPYEVEFDDGDDCIFKGKDLIVLSTEKFKVGDKVKILNTEFGNQGRVGTITTISGTVMIYLVEVVGAFGKDCQWSNASDLELVTEHEGVVVKFKVGDRVHVVAQHSAFYGDKGTVTENDGTDNLPIHVNFDVDGHVCWFYEDDLKVLYEEEKVMKFKVGDRVRMIRNTYGNRGKIGTLEKIDTSTMPYRVVFDDGRTEWCYGNEFKLLKEEKVMKFKVGDKVKVSNSWEGRSGEVGEIIGADDRYKFKYTVAFNDGFAESFREGELELVKGKQSFTKSDLKTGMGVVLRNGRKGHVLVDTGCVDVIRFLENGNYSCLNDFSDDLTSNYKEEHDIVEVYFTEYQFKLLTDKVFDKDCVFKREEPTKMTMKEINEHFGKPIEIVE